MKASEAKTTMSALLLWCAVLFGCSTPGHQIKQTKFLLDVRMEPRLDMPGLCAFDET